MIFGVFLGSSTVSSSSLFMDTLFSSFTSAVRLEMAIGFCFRTSWLYIRMFFSDAEIPNPSVSNILFTFSADMSTLTVFDISVYIPRTRNK